MNSPTEENSTPPSLVAEIRSGGPLARLFHAVVAEEETAARRSLARQPTENDAIELLAAARRRLAHRTSDSPLATLRACSAGCSACCLSVSVDITPLEALAVAQHLRNQHSPERLEQIRARLAANVARRKQTPPDQQRQLRLPCGLLGPDGMCQTYDARPLVCAGVFSLSSVACGQAVATDQPALTAAAVPLDRPAKAAAMGSSGGLQRALSQAGLDGNLYELNSIVLQALDTPDGLRRWLRGEDIFKPCICTDRHSPPRLPRLHLRIDAPESPRHAPTKLERAKRRKRQRR